MGEQIFTMKSEVVGLPFVVSDDLDHSVDQKVCDIRCFTISELSCEFPQVSRTVLYEIITSFAQHGSRKFSRALTKRREWLPV
jgi:hypothetical protein